MTVKMTTLIDDSQLQTTVQQEKVRLLYLGLPATLAISLVISSLLVALEWSRVDHSQLLLWLALFFVVVGLRASLLVLQRRSTSTGPIWLHRFRFGVMASGIMWGLGAYFMFPADDTNAQFWLTLIMLGVSAMGAASHSVDRVSSLLIAYLPFFPVLLLLSFSPQISILLPAIGGFYLLYVVVNSARMQSNQLDNIRLRLNAAKYTEKLRIDEERWHLALEGAGAGVWDWDIPADRILYSKSWKSQLGFQDTEIGDGVSEWQNRIHAEDKASTLLALQSHFDDITTHYHCEHRLLCKDGSYKWCLANGQIVGRDVNGKPLRFIGVLTDISKLKLAEKMQESLRDISEATQSTENLMELFHRIHEVIGELLPAKNFFVALYDDATNELTFPYYIDEFDPAPEARQLDQHTLSAQIIRSRQALLLTPKTRTAAALGAHEVIGSDSLDWLGVPLLIRDRVIGVLVVQSYSGDVRYTERDQQLLQFVSGQTAIAIERRQTQDRLDYENRIQIALHKISEAAHTSEQLQDLFPQIHTIIGDLLPAKNFFVALYDSAKDELSFPYFVDEKDPPPGPLKLGEGTLSSRVLKTGEALLLTRDGAGSIPEQDTALVGSAFVDWLGVPLIANKQNIGVLAVQSYAGLIRYTEKDKELLKFVSTQIATAIARKQTDEHIRHLAQHDVLTDLPNRALFNDRLQVAITRHARYKEPMALMYLDLDKFKPVNDTYGHAVGDLLLKQAAQRISQCVRVSDTVGRIGGDEFLVLLHSIKVPQSASVVAEKIRSALAQPFTILEHTLSISGSIGVAIYPENGCDQKTLALKADAAMYQAKNEGGNRYVIVEGVE
jgi:diguanylate cyclase (GGDEF)-like protein/PAS domain S-box-containing protein